MGIVDDYYGGYENLALFTNYETGEVDFEGAYMYQLEGGPDYREEDDDDESWNTEDEELWLERDLKRPGQEAACAEQPRRRQQLWQAPVVPDQVHVSNLPYSCTREALIHAFTSSAFQPVQAVLPLDRLLGTCRGFGFVTFATPEEATAAIRAMDGAQVLGRRIRVNPAHEQQQPGSGAGRRPQPVQGPAAAFPAAAELRTPQPVVYVSRQAAARGEASSSMGPSRPVIGKRVWRRGY